MQTSSDIKKKLNARAFYPFSLMKYRYAGHDRDVVCLCYNTTMLFLHMDFHECVIAFLKSLK